MVPTVLKTAQGIYQIDKRGAAIVTSRTDHRLGKRYEKIHIKENGTRCYARR